MSLEFSRDPIENIVTTYRTSVGELLSGHQIDEPKGLSLATAPLLIRSYVGGDPDTTEYAAYLDSPLNGLSLFSFLRHIAPNGDDDSIDGVRF
ncbi:MAG: hypothetical protein AAB553_04230 [Patescibacteria group bacterium]